ncbi:hypothetical protein STANM309S_00450 [Streptomyces tanashiensis]
MLPTQRTALVEMSRWSMTRMPSAPPCQRALTTAWRSCWWMTRSLACGSGYPGAAWAFGGASSRVTVRPGPETSVVPAFAASASSFSSSARVEPSSRAARESTWARRAAVDSSRPAFLWLRSSIRSESLRSEASVRMLVPLAVLKLVTKISPARAKTASVSTRTGRHLVVRPGPSGVSAELLNVP